ncbi:MAG: hypothetical protein EB084_05210 [Proteobacteria bacterium]|nr:hypothetical protein [Pseudomonadota bacterium]
MEEPSTPPATEEREAGGHGVRIVVTGLMLLALFQIVFALRLASASSVLTALPSRDRESAEVAPVAATAPAPARPSVTVAVVVDDNGVSPRDLAVENGVNVVMRVRNAGKARHGLRVEGMSMELPLLEPGANGQLETSFGPGFYSVTVTGSEASKERTLVVDCH